ncbi:DNA topoisomerase III [Enterococcus faecium]|nr:DNA topoisomerase III [Enterococcus faecium]
MSTVILAEKPSQALAYASALKQSTKKDGYFEIKDPLFTDETFITFGFGHLVELAEPGHYDEKWQNWKLESLPIFPDRYDFEVAKDKGKQFKIVAELLKKANTIIVATDSDREGENIAWSIIHKANAFSKDKTFKRLWINSLEKDVIRSGFQNLQPGMNYYPFYQEAQTRQIADWLIGMNASPLYTLNLQQKGVQGTFSLGRVQTPTLYLIFQRQEAIENFKKEPFFEVEASIKVNQGSFKGVLSPTQRFKTQEELLAFVSSKQAKIGNQEGIIADVQTKEKKTNSPSLFSLSSLQSKVNQLYKATASQTLKAMQGLYEAKLLSYPRTDTPFITENEFAYLKANFGKYSGFLGLDLEMVQTEPRKRYVDGSKVQEHHAIIPTKQVPTESALAKMDDLQRKIYALVVKTTVAMFLPDYLYEETKIQTKVADLLFQSIGKTPKQEGWKILFKQQTKEEKEDVQTLPLVIIGERAEVGVKSVEKETQPPKAFTEGTLLTAMKTANKTVDDEEAIKILQEVEGIGTEATRASIIEALKQKEYIQVIKNKLFQKYSQMSRSQKGLAGAGEWETLKKMLPDFKGKRVLDLGCGYGWHCIYAMENGASSVVGVDISHKMLEVAKGKTHFPQIEYECCAIEDVDFPEESFDVILSSLAFHYVADYENLIKKIYRMLKAGGNLVFTVEHPVFTAHGTQDWYYNEKGEILHFPVDNYYYEGKRTAMFLEEKVTKYHRTLTTYLNTLLSNSFIINQIVEPQPPENMMDIPGMADEMRRPMMLIVSAKKKM